jgi:hypothetical protein
MQDDDRTVPTLETIPAELKLVIADYFDPDVPLDLRWSQVAQYESQSRRAAVRSLSLVSRNWAVALEDLRWQVSRAARSPCAVMFSVRVELNPYRTDSASSCDRY